MPSPSSRPRAGARGACTSPRHCAGLDRHPPVGRLPRAAQHRHRALPQGRRRSGLRGPPQQHLLAACARGRSRRRPGRAGVRPPAARAAAAAGALGSSPLLEGHDTNLQSARTLTFTRTFPRCGVPDAYGSWAAYPRYLESLIRVGSIVEATQVWWSIRPHLRIGTVEVRICDAQPDAAPRRGAGCPDHGMRCPGCGRDRRGRAVHRIRHRAWWRRTSGAPSALASRAS